MRKRSTPPLSRQQRRALGRAFQKWQDVPKATPLSKEQLTMIDDAADQIAEKRRERIWALPSLLCLPMLSLQSGLPQTGPNGFHSQRLLAGLSIWPWIADVKLITQSFPGGIMSVVSMETRVMDDRALISEINKILDIHGLEHGKRDAAISVLWVVLHSNSTSTSTKKICDDGSILTVQHWNLSNNGRDNEMKVELSYNTDTPTK